MGKALKTGVTFANGKPELIKSPNFKEPSEKQKIVQNLISELLISAFNLPPNIAEELRAQTPKHPDQLLLETCEENVKRLKEHRAAYSIGGGQEQCGDCTARSDISPEKLAKVIGMLDDLIYIAQMGLDLVKRCLSSDSPTIQRFAFVASSLVAACQSPKEMQRTTKVYAQLVEEMSLPDALEELKEAFLNPQKGGKG